jgi:hypothetical protein
MVAAGQTCRLSAGMAIQRACGPRGGLLSWCRRMRGALLAHDECQERERFAGLCTGSQGVPPWRACRKYCCHAPRDPFDSFWGATRPLGHAFTELFPDMPLLWKQRASIAAASELLDSVWSVAHAPLLALFAVLRELGIIVIAARDWRLCIQSALGDSCNHSAGFSAVQGAGSRGIMEQWCCSSKDPSKHFMTIHRPFAACA